MIDITVDGTPYPVPSSARDTNWAAKQIAFEQALATAVNEPLAPLTWTTATLTNTWAAKASEPVPAYTLAPNGMVGVRGGMTAGGGGPGASCMTLPSGMRPLARSRFIVAAGASGEFVAAVLVNIDGTVVVSQGVGSTTTDIRNGTYLNFWFSTA